MVRLNYLLLASIDLLVWQWSQQILHVVHPFYKAPYNLKPVRIEPILFINFPQNKGSNVVFPANKIKWNVYNAEWAAG